MQILNLPYLAQENILQQMTYGSLFIFSLSSKKSLRLVRSVKFKEIDRIEYQWLGCRLKVVSRNKSNKKQEIITIYSNRLDERRRTKFIRIIGTSEQGRLVYITDPPVHKASTYLEHAREQHQMLPPHWPGLVVETEDMNDNPAVEAILNHIDILFGRNMTYRFFGYPNKETPMYIPKMTRIVENRFNFGRGTIDAETLDRYFSKLPVQEFVRLSWRVPIGHIPPNSKIFDSKILDVNCIYRIKSDILLNFRGQTIIVQRAVFNTEDIINFLKRWKSKEASEALKVMNLTSEFRPNCFDPEIIKRELEFKELPAANQLQIRKYFERSQYSFGSPLESQIIIPTYIVRDDGIVGYCLITHNTMYFRVTLMTEERLMSK